MPDDTRAGCGHVPLRFEARFLDSVDLKAGRAIALGVRAIRQLVAGDLSMVLLSGPVGCGKSHLAAAACNELAAPLQAAVAAAEDADDRRRSESAELWRRESASRQPGGEPFTEEARDRLLELARTDEDIQTELRRAERRLDRECPVWVSVPLLLGNLRRAMGTSGGEASADVVEAMDSRGLVVLDDLGAEKATEWTASTIFEIVGPRYDRGLPILVTSNLSASELAAAGYDRIVSRLADGGALVEMATAGDFRMRLRRSVA